MDDEPSLVDSSLGVDGPLVGVASATASGSDELGSGASSDVVVEELSGVVVDVEDPGPLAGVVDVVVEVEQTGGTVVVLPGGVVDVGGTVVDVLVGIDVDVEPGAVDVVGVVVVVVVQTGTVVVVVLVEVVVEVDVPAGAVVEVDVELGDVEVLVDVDVDVELVVVDVVAGSAYE